MQIVQHIIIDNDVAYIAQRGYLKAEMVARMVVDGKYSVEETAQHYDLSVGEVYAALAYYHDNKAVLDKRHQAKQHAIRKTALDADEYLQTLKTRHQNK
jgi:hypothetical protein